MASVQAMIMGAEHLTDAHIQGHAVEQGTGEHIPFLTVRLLGTNIGTNTDATGHYFLKNIPEGDYEIEISGIGYVPQTRKVKVRKGHTAEVQFELKPDVFQIETVVVTGNDPNGFEVAPARRYLNEKGMTVVTMKYRTPRPAGLQKHIPSAAAASRWTRSRSEATVKR